MNFETIFMFAVLRIKLLTLLTALASKVFKVSVPPIPSVMGIIENKEKILVIRLTYEKGYALPGGVLKGNENFAEALRREVKEETGLKVTNIRYLNTYCSVEKYAKVCVGYIAKAKGKLKGSKEGTPVWRSPRHIVKKLFYSDNVDAVKDFLRLKRKRNN